MFEECDEAHVRDAKSFCLGGRPKRLNVMSLLGQANSDICRQSKFKLDSGANQFPNQRLSMQKTDRWQGND